MTADRRADRRLARVHNASPYSQKTRNAKPPQQKSSGWSLSGFLKYLNPLWSRSSEEQEEETEEETSQDELDTNQSPQSTPDVFESRTQPVQPPPPPPPAARQPNPFVDDPSTPAGPNVSRLSILPEPSASPLKNVDAVKTYLEQNGGRPLNQVEIAGLVSMLQDTIEGIDDDTQQPFRFSKSPSRADSPIATSFPTASSSTISSNTAATPKTPPRTLSKNPNGTYKWQGAGSARRNRYHSPAFGSPSSGNKIKLQPAETAKSDSKRRRVGQDAETSSPQKTSSRQSSTEPETGGPSNSSAPDNRDTGVNGHSQSKPQLNGINTSKLNKGTAPAVSSPLRQAWGQDDLPSPNSSPTSVPKPSRAAAFMTELIREATPPKKPDIANPYQTASPVKTVKPSAKKSIRKPRPVSQPPAEEKEKKHPEMTMQSIIEATLPKGSKRSRPPAHLSASPNGSAETSTVEFPSQSPSPPPKQSQSQPLRNGAFAPRNGSRMVTVEEVGDEEELPSPKKQKKAPTPAEPIVVEVIDPQPPFQPFIRPSEVIEPGDVPQPHSGASSAPAVSPTTAGRSFFGLKSSAPKEPSKLRFSIKADRDETASSASSVSPTAPTSPKDAKAEVISIPISDLPAEAFTLPRRMIREGRSSVDLRAEKEARGFDDDDIPMDDVWKFPPTSVRPSSTSKAGPSTTPTVLPVSNSTTSLPTTSRGFDWGAAGLKPQKPEDGWKCSTCDLMNPSSATEKCAVCDAPNPGAAKPLSSSPPMPKPPFTSFPFGSTTDTTTTTFTASSSSRGFSWDAAGLKPPTNIGGWKCATCDLMNPASATEKCTVCDAQKPGAETSSTTPSFSMPKPPSSPFVFASSNTSSAKTAAPTNSSSGGFDWSAAGMKPPTMNAGGWKCGTCGLMNLTSAKEKCTVCDAPKLGTPSSGSGTGPKSVFSMPTPPPGPFLFGVSSSAPSTSTTSGLSFGVSESTGAGPNQSFTGFGPPSSTTTATTVASSGTGGGFNWDAAGLKPPSDNKGWRCATCGLTNPGSAKEKCTVCDSSKP